MRAKGEDQEDKQRMAIIEEALDEYRITSSSDKVIIGNLRDYCCHGKVQTHVQHQRVR